MTAKSPVKIEKVLFLDIQGVLDSARTARHLCNIGQFDVVVPHKYHIKILNWILKETGAEIVVTSTERKRGLMPTKEWLYSLGVTKGTIRGVTPDLGGNRAEEIFAWLLHNPVQRVAIVDDRGIGGPLNDKVVYCTNDEGLTWDKARELVEILNQ